MSECNEKMMGSARAIHPSFHFLVVMDIDVHFHILRAAYMPLHYSDVYSPFSSSSVLLRTSFTAKLRPHSRTHNNRRRPDMGRYCIPMAFGLQMKMNIANTLYTLVGAKSAAVVQHPANRLLGDQSRSQRQELLQIFPTSSAVRFAASTRHG